MILNFFGQLSWVCSTIFRIFIQFRISFVSKFSFKLKLYYSHISQAENFFLLIFLVSRDITLLLYLHAFLHLYWTKMAKQFELISSAWHSNHTRSNHTCILCKGHIFMLWKTYDWLVICSCLLRSLQNFYEKNKNTEPVVPTKIQPCWMAANMFGNRPKMVLAATRINYTSLRHRRLLDSRIRRKVEGGWKWIITATTTESAKCSLHTNESATKSHSIQLCKIENRRVPGCSKIITYSK